MRRENKGLRALVCAVALLANGAGALGQDQVQVRERQAAEKAATERAAQEGQEKQRIMIDQMPRIEIATPQGGGGGVIIGAPGEYGFSFFSSEMAFDSKVIKGAPFSADAVTESVQVLGDGNRITRTSTSKLYRDGEGRTRREQTMNGVGALATSVETPQTIFINDPVVGTNYILNSETRTAQVARQYFFKRPVAAGEQPGAKTEGTYTFTRTPATGMTEISAGRIAGKAQKRVQPTYPAVARAAGAQGGVDVEVVVDEQGNVESAKAISGHQLLRDASVEAARQWTFKPTMLEGKPVKVKGIISFVFEMSAGKGFEGATTVEAHPTATATASSTREGNVMLMRTRTPGDHAEPPPFAESRESLGKQSVEGIEAEGTRTTITIPAGAMGNERPILIVSERWYSAELQTVVMTKHSDPRFGETTYRLTNISRSEPDHSLFEVPAGYTVNDLGSAPGAQLKMLERKLQNELKPQP
jgi:TonB family protein